MSVLQLKRAPGDNETLDGPPHGPRFLQYRKGQRVASDDILLAAVGHQVRPAANNMLDLGTGKGSVALMYLHANPGTTVVGLEAYPPSFELAVRNRAINASNNLDSPFVPVLCDLRHSQRVLGDRTFDLITGAPPFIRVGHGIPPKNQQRRFGRIEERGGIEAYCHAVAHHLDRNVGVSVLLMDGQNKTRTTAAFNNAGLYLNQILDIVPRPNRPPIYQIFVGSYTDQPLRSYTVAMRNLTGNAWSTAYATLRSMIGLL